MLQLSDQFREMYPNAHIGYIAMSNLQNNVSSEELLHKKKLLEEDIREKYKDCPKSELAKMEPLQSYVKYYKKFKKTYHVLLQLESIAKKGRDIPNVDCLVEAMFMAEVKNHLLTAGHDIEKVSFPITVDVSNGTEDYVSMSGKEESCHSGDMYMRDQEGILSCIVSGPDKRSKISMNTHKCIYVVYGPEGVNKEMINEHLQEIKDNVSLICKDVVIDKLEVL